MVKRYNPVRQHGGCIMVEYEDGEYVRHREYAALAERCERLEVALDHLIAAADPVALAPREYERIREQTARGLCISIDPFPLLKCRYEDVMGLNEGLQRARIVLAESNGGKA